MRSYENNADAGISTTTEAGEKIVDAHGAHFRHVWMLVVLFSQILASIIVRFINSESRRTITILIVDL